jgi:uncharacterized membrane protein
MRAFIVAGLSLTVFLTWVHGAALRSAVPMRFPLCGKLPGLDCESVLNSHWATVGGTPVAAFGLGVYLLLFVSAIRFPGCPLSRATSTFFVAMLAGGGVWFIGVQAFDLHQWCLWCTTTHVISIALAGMIWPMAISRGRPAMIGLLITAGLACAAAMAGAQYSLRPGVEGLTTLSGPGQLLSDVPKLNLSEHIVVGPPNAEKIVIEAMDFRCHRCAEAWPVVEEAQRLLGGKVAVVVLPTPLSADCNPYIEHTPGGFELSCELAKLAWAVRLSDAAQYPSYHRWLLTHQQCTLDQARAKARALVGDQLETALADPLIGQFIKRDVELAAALNLEQLPAMVAGRLRIRAIPDDAQTLAMLWTTGLAKGK